jgi:hypothetical protein
MQFPTISRLSTITGMQVFSFPGRLISNRSFDMTASSFSGAQGGLAALLESTHSIAKGQAEKPDHERRNLEANMEEILNKGKMVLDSL